MKYKKRVYALLILSITAVFSACDNLAEPKEPEPIPTPEIVRGTYWGKFDIGGKEHDTCLVIGETFAALHSDFMGKKYPFLKCVDKGGMWTISCYLKGENMSKPTTHTIITVNTTVSPHTCKVDVIPMRGGGGGFKDYTKGEAYDGRFKN